MPETSTLSVSDWRQAPFRVNGETVYAIGDVHGCVEQLNGLTNWARHEARQYADTRCILLGDLVCRGPDSVGALAHWASAELDAAFTRVHRLAGNHEQLLMLALAGGETGARALAKWMSIDGDTFLREIQRKTGQLDAALSRSLVEAAAGARLMTRLDALEHHVRLGNVVFVHGGVDPAIGIDASLAQPWTEFGGNHWAWIMEPFLGWRQGFGGSFIVHGHTPPAKHRIMSGYPDPHLLQHDRLSLDGGSALTGVVAAAEIQDGRYRLVLAGPQV